ncbi:MAG: aminoacyl-tRNA hydrolase [Bacteroidales bacterium]|nr:aminoacyl-tRNA hydrolase [Bacteroidales bacterium]
MNSSQLEKELIVKTSRSGGPGGQHVNKTETRVELHFQIESSLALSDEEKSLLLARLKNKLTQDGRLIVVSSNSRSQLANKFDAEQKLKALLIQNMQPIKKRKKTKPSKASVEKRLESKKNRGAIKNSRRKPDY